MNAEEIKGLVQGSTQDYYNRWAKEKRWAYMALIAGRAMQSPEINELQHMLEEKTRSLGRAMYADGTVLSGCTINISADLRTANMEAGRIAIDGLVYEVEAATLTIPDPSDVKIGIWLKRRVLTENEDETLLDPAINWKMYLHPGAFRIIETAEWGINKDGLNFPFYPLYDIDVGNNQVVNNVYTTETTPEFIDALARYDRDSNGHYVVEGLRVMALPNADGADDGKKQTYSISEGLAHIRGYEARLSHAVRLVVDEEADLFEVVSEAHEYASDGTGSAVVPTHQTPIEAIRSVRVTKEETVELLHGTYTGCSDDLPQTSVIKIVSVTQGGTTFVQGTDYRLDANKINWDLAGGEPAPGSRYVITYHYRTNVEPDASDYTSLTLSGLVEGSLVEVDYTYRMPRKDIIIMYRDSSIALVKGVPHRYAPVLPATPPEAICLAEVEQTWTGLPTVKNVAVQAVRMDELNKMQSALRDLYNLTARQEMRVDAILAAPSSAFGVFVDPLLDDDMRDAGTPQTARVAGQMLQLPMASTVSQFPTGREIVRDFTHEAIIDQSRRSKDMRVNPYMAFDPLPAVVSLEPAVDRWTTTRYTTATTFTGGSWPVAHESMARIHETTSSYTAASMENDVAGILRQIPVTVTATGFDYLEPVTVSFDGVEVVCDTDRADETGTFIGTFTIPRGIPTGSRLVHVQSETTSGDAIFIGTMDVLTITAVTVEHREVYHYTPAPPDPVDPLGQTFTLSESRHVTGVDIWVGKKDVSPLEVEIREVELGWPTRTVLARKRLAPEDLQEGAFNRIVFDSPVFLTGGTEYVLVVKADTADWEVGVVEIGDFEEGVGFVRSQAYTAGVLMSSSNASTWSPHQFADLTFRILGAGFEEGRKVVQLGTVDLTGVTDLFMLAEVQVTSAATDVTFVVSQGGVEVARMQAWQPISFDTPLEGEFDITAEMFGDAKHSPILGRDPQLAAGTLGQTGDYVSRSFPCGTGRRVMITTSEFVPAGADVKVYVETGNGVWTEAQTSESTPIGEGWHRNIRFVPCSMPTTRLKIELTGHAGARPLVAGISGVILDAI